jgi:hypothetical protein
LLRLLLDATACRLRPHRAAGNAAACFDPAGIGSDRQFGYTSGMYERRHHPLASRRVYLRRVASNILLGSGIIALSLLCGVLGYKHLEHLSWVDALLNASMIMGGMGPVDVMKTVAGKLFASFYALYSGFVLLLTAGIILAPVVHRLMHRFHCEISDNG